MVTILKSLFKLNLNSIRLKSKRRRKKRIIFPKLRRRGGGPRYKRSGLLPDIQAHIEQIKKNSWEKMNSLREHQINVRLRKIPFTLKDRLYNVAKQRVKVGATKYLIDRYSKQIRRLNKRRYKFAFGSKGRFPFRRNDEAKFYHVYPRLRDRSRRFKLARYNFFKIALRPLLIEPVINTTERKAQKDYFFEVPQVKRKVRSLRRRLRRAEKMYQSYLGGPSSLARWSKYDSYKPVIQAFVTPVLQNIARVVHKNKRFRKPVWLRFLKFLEAGKSPIFAKVKHGNSAKQLTAYQYAYYNIRKLKPVQRRMLFRRRKRLIRFINYFGFITSRAGRWFRPRRLYIRSKVFKVYKSLAYYPILKRLRSKRIKQSNYRYNVDLPKLEFRLRFRRRLPFSGGHRPEKLRRAQTKTQFRKLKSRRWRFWNLLRRIRKFRLIRRRYKIVGRYGEIQRGDLNVLPKIDVPVVELRETANNFYIVVKQSNKTLFDRTCGMVYPYGAPKFEGPKRRTTYAAEVLGKHVGRMLLMKQMPHIQLRIKTRPNEKVKAAIKGIKGVEIPVKFAALYKAGRLVRASFHGVRRVHVDRVSINVPLSHNGLRRRKPRRI